MHGPVVARSEKREGFHLRRAETDGGGRNLIAQECEHLSHGHIVRMPITTA